MDWKRLVVALLLLASLGRPVQAADDPEHESKNARKILAMLGSFGINDPSVQSFISGIDSHIKDGYLTLDEHRIASGTLTLHYQLSKSVTSRQLELKFALDDSHWQATARPNAVMFSYQYKF
jgi:hypothetical protein